MRISDWSSDVCSSDLPGADFTLKASWGRSFKAPTLFQRFSSKNAYLDAPPSRFGGTGYDDDATVLSTSGGNRNLDPERDRKSTRLNSSHSCASRMPSSA